MTQFTDCKGRLGRLVPKKRAILENNGMKTEERRLGKIFGSEFKLRFYYLHIGKNFMKAIFIKTGNWKLCSDYCKFFASEKKRKNWLKAIPV